MTRWVVSALRTGAALGVALATAAGASAQGPTVWIDDQRVVEGTGSLHYVTLTVTLSDFPSTPVDVSWKTLDGSAIAGQDYIYAQGTLTFSPASKSQTLDVAIVADPNDEWDTRQLDDAFFVDLTLQTTGSAVVVKGRATVTIVDDDQEQSPGVPERPGLQLLSAAADTDGANGRVRLQWRVPASSAFGDVTDVLVRWNEGAGCLHPTYGSGATGQFWLSTYTPVGQAGNTQRFVHGSRPFVRHCYTLFAIYSGTPTAVAAMVAATPRSATHPSRVAWSYTAGWSSGGAPLPTLVPPTVGTEAVYTIGNDGVVHAMERGTTGGGWPSGWNPVGLGKPAHDRSPVIPLQEGPRLLVGTDSGEVHAVNGRNGAIAWSRSAAFMNPLLPNLAGAKQGTPAGIFTDFGGNNDAILVGTDVGTADNKFFMLDPVTGVEMASFGDTAMGGMPGMPAVDYSANRVYFVTNSDTATLWALDVSPKGSPPALARPPAFPVNVNVGSNGSPVVRSGWVFFGAGNDLVAVPASGGTWYSINLSDGPVKGFVFPDRRGDALQNALYLATNDTVWGLGYVPGAFPTSFPYRWSETPVTSPSMVLHWPGTDYLYFGDGSGQLWEVDVQSGNPPVTKSVVLEANTQIGAPSLDVTNGLVLVGSVTGVVYAVRVPLL